MSLTAAVRKRAPWLTRLPEGWRLTTLEQIVDPQRPICYGVVQPGDDSPNGVPLVRSGDVHDGVISHDLRTIPKTIAQNYRRSALRGGEVVVSLVGEPGQAARVSTKLAGANIARQVGLVAIPDPELAAYVEHYLNSDVGRTVLLAPIVGSAQQVINIADLKKTAVPIPPRERLAKIVELAELWTGIRSRIERLAQVKGTFKRGLMQQLLIGQRRFPKFCDLPWTKARIGDLFEEIERPVDWDDSAEYRLVSIRRRSGGMFLREVKKASEIKTKQLYVVHAGDIVISRMQVVHGAVSIVPPEFDGCCVSGMYLVLVPRPKATIDPRFFDYLTQTPRMYYAANTSSYGVHIEKMTLNPEWYLETPVLLPQTVEEQHHLVEVLNMVGREIDQLTRLGELIGDQRRTVLARLLSGARSVSS